MADPFRIVIAGGGVAGLETLLALRALVGMRAHVTLVTDRVQTVDRPLTVAEPFGRAAAPTRDVMAIAHEQQAELLLSRLEIVRTGNVDLTGDLELPYDALVVATGAGRLTALEHATSFAGLADVPAMRAIRAELLAGTVRSVAFAVPSTRVWPLPIYELAMMTGADLLAAGVTGTRITIVTPEQTPLALFGPRAAEELAPLLEARGVEVRCATRPLRVEPGHLVVDHGAPVEAERVVALPEPRGRPPAGLPTDAAGFIRVDRHGRVPGHEHVYAAGDVTAFPLKQGGLAAQQADAVAESIAAQMGLHDDPQPFRPIVRGMLLIGGAPVYLRAEIGAGPGVAQRIGAASEASSHALWWPPAKVAARYLGPYLATARPRMLTPATLVDRVATSTPAGSGHDEALALALAMAEADAHWGDYAAALRALDAAEALQGTLPVEYAEKRREWAAAR
jgi:sulfide:quinone oxidoreductase